MKYWLCISNEANWNVAKNKNIWGFSETNRRQLERVKSGDYLVFYVKPSRIGGIFQILESFEDDKGIFNSSEFGGEKFPNRVRLKPILAPNKLMDFKPLIKKLDIIRRKDKKWGTSLFGRAVAPLSSKDYTVISTSLKEFSETST